MNKIIEEVDKERGIKRITVCDERWYIRESKDKETGLPVLEYVPSVTWIAGYYYTSPYLVKWIADKGISESERIRDEAGLKGGRLHKAVEMWLNGEEIKIDSKIECEGETKELTPEENESFKSFIDFYTEIKPKIIKGEYVVFGNGYAGTVDLKCEIDGELGILDIKSSQAIYREHELQISAYRHADPDKDKITKQWILQIGYRRNKAKWKLTEVEDKFKLFLNAKDTWFEENKNSSPRYTEFPLIYPTKKELDSESITPLEAPTAKGIIN